MSLSKVIEVARGELGVTEVPAGSNRVKYWDDYDPKMQGQPWCVAFLWSIFQHAGERMAFFGGGKTASCGTLLMWYQNMEQTVPVSEVQVGDIVILNFHGTQDTEHCGLVVEVKTSLLLSDPPIPTIDAIITIEGNTTSRKNGVQDNGGMVCEKERYPYQIVAVCRPQYKPDEPVLIDTKPDYVDHWAEKSIRRAIYSEIMTGYPDSSFRPNDPVTRAELATILDRLGLLG